MNRKEFLKICATLFAGAPLLSSLLTSCNKNELPEIEINFSGKVLIIGAGAAGLTAGYVLSRYGIDFEILEASSVWGGRVRKNETFADVPLDIGAEWVHASPKIFAEILKDKNAAGDINLIRYAPEDQAGWYGNTLTGGGWVRGVYGEYKFKSSTWYDFLDQYIAPASAGKITYNAPVNQINYSGAKVELITNNLDVYEGDKVLIAIPAKMLQNEFITFSPALPSVKTETINSLKIPDGAKVYMEFSEKFYPDYLTSESGSEFFDVLYRKDSSKNILCLFLVGDHATAFTQHGNDHQAIVDMALAELDTIYNGKASATYLNHMVQNWSAEPFIQGAYMTNASISDSVIIQEMAQSIDDKLYFAGSAWSNHGQSTVHGAALSAYDAVGRILKG